VTNRLTRRNLLAGAGGAWGLSALSSRFARAAESGSVMVKLSEYMATAGARALPPEAVESTKQHILDTFAAMVSGCDLAPAQVALKFARAHAGEKTATVVVSGTLCGPIEAAMVNGMLAHSDETDDSHAPSHSHPGCAVVPAAFAAGEQFNIDGTRFVRAVALGYDIGARVGMTLGGLPWQIADHHSSHSICGTFGAAAAAGCAANLSAQQMRWVLDYAAQQAAGIAAWQRDTDHIEKSLVFAGMPARDGVSAALIIQLGGTGVEDIFSGSDNFLMAFSPKADSTGLIDRLGERFEVSRTNIKKWTVGSPVQAPLDAIVNLRKKRPFAAEEVQNVVVRVATSEAKTVNNREMPDISLQHLVAVMLLDQTVTFRAAHDKPRMNDPAVRRERAKIELVPDEALEKLYPRRETIVEVTLKSGEKLTERVSAVRGTAENPMTHEEVVAKSRDLMNPVLGVVRCSQLIDQIMNLENLKSVHDLRPLLQRA
jgi:2-methylcitrate dehydratase PrpD